jgi:hypothetical protein
MNKYQLHVVIFLLLLTHYGFAYFFHANTGHEQDDNLFLISSSFQLQDNQSYNFIENEIRKTVESYGESALNRFDLRSAHSNTYTIPLYIYNLSNRVLEFIYEPNDSRLNKYLAILIPISFLLSSVFSFLILIVCSFFLLNKDQGEKLFLSLAIFSLIAIIADIIKFPYAIWTIDNPTLFGYAKNTILSIFRPTYAFSYFGWSPRSNMLVIVYLFILLRWDRFKYASYVLPIALLFHASQGVVILIFFFLSDLIFNPKNIINLHYLFSCLLSAIIFLTMGGDYIGIIDALFDFRSYILIGSIALIAILIFWHRYKLGNNLLTIFGLNNNNIIKYDLLSFFIIGLVSHFVLYDFYLESGEFSKEQFVTHFHHRYYSSLSIIPLYFIIDKNYLTIIKKLTNSIIITIIGFITAITIVLSIGLSWRSLNYLNELENYPKSYEFRESKENYKFGKHEIFVYYAFLRSLVLKNDYYKNI